uniref:Uncharacterized protein n=1 Tax=Anopheles maculatus TaxID=74869 RepID=A0A182ST75_9DIPT
MSKQSIPREQIVGNNKRDVKVKQKRKNAHQVRKYFLPAGETKQKCTFCGWVTRENATRMVQHIVQRCNEASTAAREEISASVVDAEERELQSYYTSHNKKAVHDFFKSVDNDRKRQCVFCRWSTVLNLTRMRYHILQMCHYVPPEVRQSFLKQEYTDSDSLCDTYCIVNVDDGDRKGVTLVSSSSLEHSDGTLVEEVVIETEDFDADNQEEVDGYYETIIPDQLEEEDDLRDLNQLDNETEVELVDCGNPIEEITLPSVQKNEDTRLINLSDRYYNVGKRRVSERSPRAANDHSGTKKTRTEVQELQNDKKLTRSAAVKELPALNQPGSRDQPVRRFRTGTSTPNIVVKKETVMKPSPPQETDHQPMQKNEKQSESQTTPRQKTAAIARSSPQPKTPVQKPRHLS